METDIDEVDVVDPHRETDAIKEMTISVMTTDEESERKKVCLQ